MDKKICTAPIRLVIWDWNGTLVDDARASFESVNDMLIRRSLPLITFEQYSSYIETPIIGFYRHIFDDLDSMDFGQISREFHEGSALHMRTRGLMPGAREVLEQLRGAGVKQVIVSSCEKEMLARQASGYGVAEYFDAILGADDFHAGSKIDRAKAYMAQCGIPPAQTVSIGDILHDTELSQAIGAKCILIAKGHQTRADLEPSGELILDDITQAGEYILRRTSGNL